MKAYVMSEAGGVEDLVLSDIERPDLKDGEVLVETKAISVNHARCPDGPAGAQAARQGG